jgi:hypothetical protein
MWPRGDENENESGAEQAVALHLERELTADERFERWLLEEFDDDDELDDEMLPHQDLLPVLADHEVPSVRVATGAEPVNAPFVAGLTPPVEVDDDFELEFDDRFEQWLLDEEELERDEQFAEWNTAIAPSYARAA